MVAKLNVPRGADLTLTYQFPGDISFLGYDGLFRVYQEQNGTLLLTFTTSPSVNGSQMSFDGNVVTVFIKKEDINALPVDADDSENPSVLFFDNFVTSPAEITSKIHGGAFIVRPYGASVTSNGTQYDVNFSDQVIDVTLEGGTSFTVVPTGSVRFDVEQDLSDGQKEEARGNIDVYSTEEVDGLITDAGAATAVVQSNLDAHEADTANPHATTKAQVGLSNVDNTSDANKPVSAAQQAALDLKQDQTFDYVVPSLTYNSSAPGVALANSTAIQSIINSVASGSRIRIILPRVPASDDEAVLYVSPQITQGTRFVTLVAPADINWQITTPNVERVETMDARARYSYASASDPTDRNIISRDEATNTSGFGMWGRSFGYLNTLWPAQGANDIGEVSAGRLLDVPAVMGEGANSYWHRWEFIQSPIGHDSGLPGATATEQAINMVWNEVNLVNRTKDWGYKYQRAGNWNFQIGIQIVPETFDPNGTLPPGTQYGLHCLSPYVFTCSPNANNVGALNGQHAKWYNGVMGEPDALAPLGRGVIVAGNSKLGPTGNASATTDPYAAFQAYKTFKAGLVFDDGTEVAEFRDAADGDGNAIILSASHWIAIRVGGFVRRLMGLFSSGLNLNTPYNNEFGVQIRSTGGSLHAAVNTQAASANNLPVLLSTENGRAGIYARSTVNTNVGLHLAPQGTGHVYIPIANVPNYANDAAAAAGGVAVGEIYRNGSVLMIRVS